MICPSPKLLRPCFRKPVTVLGSILSERGKVHMCVRCPIQMRVLCALRGRIELEHYNCVQPE